MIKNVVPKYKIYLKKNMIPIEINLQKQQSNFAETESTWRLTNKFKCDVSDSAKQYD